MYSLMNPLCWSRSTLINSHEQIPLFSQCCLDKLQFHLTLDSNFNSFHRTTVNTSLGIQWLNCKARSVSQLPPHAHRASPSPHAPSPTDPLCFKSQFILSHCGKKSKDQSWQLIAVCCGWTFRMNDFNMYIKNYECTKMNISSKCYLLISLHVNP